MRCSLQWTSAEDLDGRSKMRNKNLLLKKFESAAVSNGAKIKPADKSSNEVVYSKNSCCFEMIRCFFESFGNLHKATEKLMANSLIDQKRKVISFSGDR